MAQCVQLIPVVDGSYKVMTDSQPNLNSCSYVIQSGAEVGNSLFDLTPPQALEISGYIGGLWALAWGFKQIAKTLKMDVSHDE